jgi:hypothetical protein
MVSLAPYVLKRPWLTKMLTPAANWYASAAGYRQLGLRYETESFTAVCADVTSGIGSSMI